MLQKQTEYIQMVPFMRGAVCEYFISVQCHSDNQAADAIAELFAFLREKDAQPVSFRIFVKTGCFDTVKADCQHHLERLRCPVVWLSQPGKARIAVVSFQVHAVAGADVRPILDGGRNAGCRVLDENGELFFLYIPAAPDRIAGFEATCDVFENMQKTLHSAGLDFSRTLRTWLFADDILSWYDKLNLARDDFFRRYDIFNKLVPASTGVGIANPSGSPLAAELLAFHPLKDTVRVCKIVSPIQCESLDYKSSFSRAVHVETADHRRMYISGTASITPDGKTAYEGNCAQQIDLTMRVVEALINNGKMDWSDSVRAIAYFKDSRDFGLFDAFCRNAGLRLPHIKIEADVCRHELLFELELDLLSCRS